MTFSLIIDLSWRRQREESVVCHGKDKLKEL